MSSGEKGGSLELATGDRIGRFVVLTMVGRGGMGEVYAAFDPDLDRKVAVKLLRSEAGNGVDPSEGRARMLREAQTIAKLSDPNVVTVYDVGTFEGRVFLAMELVDGHTLSYWLHAQPRTWREILTCYRAAGQGLAAAHRAGIVHRDFKPDNVMVGYDGGVRVTDFGLARTVVNGSFTPGLSTGGTWSSSLGGGSSSASLGRVGSIVGGPASPLRVASTPVDGAAAIHSGETSEGAGTTRDLGKPFSLVALTGALPSGSSGLTESGAMMGTPAYMAPEQFQGKETDARSDQFSFCVALYEGLYGRRPFGGRTVDEIVRSVMAGAVRSPPARSKVPSWLHRVILRGLRHDREDRYPSMQALLAALARDSATAEARLRRIAGLAAAVTLAGILGGVIAHARQRLQRCQGAEASWAGVWELPPANGALSTRKRDIQAAFMASGKRYAADSFKVVRRFLDDYVLAWNDMHRDACEASSVREEQSAEVLDLRMGCLHDRFSEVQALTSVFLSADGDVVSKAVEATQAIRPIEPCADIGALRATVRQPDAPALRRQVAALRARLANARAMTRAGRYAVALRGLGEVLVAAENTGYAPVLAETHLQIGELQQVMGDASARVAEAHLEEAVWLAEASRHDEVAAEASVALVSVVGYLDGRSPDAERWARFSAAVLDRMGTGHDVLRAWRLNNLAMFYDRLGRIGEALDALERSIAIKTRVFGPVHVDVAISEANAAFALFELGRTEEAIARNTRALGVFAQTVGLEHPRAAFALGNGAELLRAEGKYAESRAMAERALEVVRRESTRPSFDHASGAWSDVGPEAVDYLVTLGRDWLSAGDPARAVPLLERAVALRPAGRRFGVEFVLAQALWELPRRGVRALQAAREAAVDAASDPADRDAKRQTAAINDWISERAGARPPISMR